jgi:XapX domain-containing protein
MKAYFAALGAGLVVGIVYSLMNVRSPAPPVIALVGLLGILLGEQIVPFAKRLWSGHPQAVAETRADCAEHILGPLPARPGLRDEREA